MTSLIFVLGISLALISGFVFVTLREVKTARNFSQSMRSYYAAESGVEDAIYRFITGKQITSGETLATGTATGTISIATLGAEKTITVSGVAPNQYYRKVEAKIASQVMDVGFHYGVQVGYGGLTLGDGSEIVGDVFSNGKIKGAGKAKSTVTGTAEVAGTSTIEDIKINQNAYAYSFEDCAIGGVANYFNSFSECTAGGGAVVMSQQIPAQNFPISQDDITAWENDASAGGYTSSYSLGNNTSGSLGPKHITGDVTLGNSSTLTLGGTVWISGTLTFGNTDKIKLDSSYGANGGIIIVDGAVDMSNKPILEGSGQAGSYLLLISNYRGAGYAINVGNSASSSVYFAPNGTINLGNGIDLLEATAYKIIIGNNASVTYQQGLLDTNFTSGPTANWSVKSWKEVQ